MRSLIVASAIILSLITPTKAETQACDVVFVEDMSAGAQKRVRIFAWSNAVTKDDRLSTAKWIAVSGLAFSGYDFADVYLMPKEWPKDRDLANSISASVWLRHAPDPAKIPFMEKQWKVSVADQEKPNPEWGFASKSDVSAVAASHPANGNNDCNLNDIETRLR